MNTRLVVSSAAVTVLAFLACSAVASADGECFRPVSQTPCEVRGNDIRCLARGIGTNACVSIINKSAYTVSLWYDEWHSTCGFPGEKVYSRRNVFRRGESSIGPMLPEADLGFISRTCREGFVVDCRIGDSSVRCGDVLAVELIIY